MRAFLLRLGPLVAAGIGVAVGAVLLVVADQRTPPALGIYRYPTWGAATWWAIGTGNAVGAAWYATRAPRRTFTWFVAIVFAATWAALGIALAADILYAAFGPGIEPMRACTQGGMDCIGAPRPSAPLLGDATLVSCFTAVTAPIVWVSLLTSTILRSLPPRDTDPHPETSDVASG